jgi:hypothetical protein
MKEIYLQNIKRFPTFFEFKNASLACNQKRNIKKGHRIYKRKIFPNWLKV